MLNTSPQAETLTQPNAFCRVQRFESLDSTNRYILDQARLGAKEGLVVVADEQVKGRGRLQRSWYSPKGRSLSASILFDNEGTISDAQILVKVVSLAMSSALKALYVLKVGVKWPNDLEVESKKLAGVLAEVVSYGPKTQIVVGIGVNLGQSVEELAALNRPATSVALERPDLSYVSSSELLDTFLSSVCTLYSVVRSEGGKRRITESYRDQCTTLGKRVEVRLPFGQVIDGTAVDLGEDGELIVDTSSERLLVSAGDVAHLNVHR